MRGRRLAGALVAGLVGATGGTIVTTPAVAEAAGVCAGVARCKVVARVDVDGDGTRDAVGVARRGAKGAPEGRVLVRVKTASGIVAVRRSAPYWYSAPFHGTAALDGRRGREIVVGATTGAHTSWYWVLAFRDGALRTLRAPGSGIQWPVDSAATVSIGWHRTARQPVGQVTLREASRNATEGRFTARISTYRWTPQGWTLQSRDRKRVSENRAWRWGGWHVPGLPRW